MNHRNYKQLKGFTLVEILITITIIAVVNILIAQVFFTTTRVNTKTELSKDVKQNGQYALDNIVRMIRNSSGVESECLTTGTTGKSVIVKNPNGDSTTYGCLYDSANSVSRLASTSALFSHTEYLTSQNVTLGGLSCDDINMSLQFICTANTDEPSKVEIKFSLSQKGTPTEKFEQSSIDFRTIISPRN